MMAVPGLLDLFLHRYSENQKTVEYEDDTEQQIRVFDFVTVQIVLQETYQITF